MRKYHQLTVSAKHEETPDSVRLALSVPETVQGEFEFLPGQHLSLIHI